MTAVAWTPQAGTYKDLTGVAEKHFIQFLEEVCLKMGVRIEDLLSTSRKGTLVTLRHLMMGVARWEFDLNTKTVGMIFNRDHSSIIYACKKLQDDWEFSGPTFTQMQSLQTSEEVFNSIWRQTYKTVGKWRTRKKLT